MDSIPLITSDARLFSRIASMVGRGLGADAQIVCLDTLSLALEYLNTEWPELILLHFADGGLDADAVLEAIMNDPWLIQGGIVAVCNTSDDCSRLESIRNANIIVVLTTSRLDRELPRVLAILRNNRRILFQRELGTDLVPNISGHFKLGNDPLEATCHGNLVSNFLYNANRIDGQTRNLLKIAMHEMLLNAIEHGNCNISYQEKSEWLESGKVMEDLIRQRSLDPTVASKQVTFEYDIRQSHSSFLIVDEGAGFNWQSLLEEPGDDEILELHGRGIVMARALTQNLTFNEKGNEVRFEVAHQSDAASAIPGLLKNFQMTEIEQGQIIFREGAFGDNLYFVAKGRYDVLVNDQIVSTLSPDDIFMGEMSFLLQNRRTATVRASTEGKLIEISRKDLVEAIKRNPHYALLLSRLLAQRLHRVNLASTLGSRPHTNRET